MEERTVKDLKRDASKVKHEMDELERTAHGMTFDELIRIMAGGGRPTEQEPPAATSRPTQERGGASV